MGYEKYYKVSVKGTAPLLMNKYTWNEDEKMKKTKKFNPEEAVKETLHVDDNGKLYQPSEHFEATMIKAATNYKIPGQGKKTFKDAFKGGVFVEPSKIIHENQKYDIDIRPVVIGKARVPKARGVLNEWSLQFTIKVIDERIDGSYLKQIVEEAGKYIGVGDYRPKFGRFEIIDFKEIK